MNANADRLRHRIEVIPSRFSLFVYESMPLGLADAFCLDCSLIECNALLLPHLLNPTEKLLFGVNLH